MARQIVVDIIGDSSKFGSAVDKATGKTTGFTNILKGAGMGIGLGMFSLATSAIGGVTQALGDANAAYMEDVASQEKLKVALKNSVAGFSGQTDAIEKVIAAQMRLGFGDEEQRDSLALLVGSTNDVVKAQQLQVAAMDLARLRGIDLATATDIMLKANEGNYRGLKSVGITLDANATSTEMLAAVTAVAGGQAEAYAKGPLGKQEAAQLKVGESMERIGEIVNKVSSAVLPIAADAFEAVVNVIGDLWKEIEPVINQLVRRLTPAFKAIAAFLVKNVFPVVRTFIGTYLRVLFTLFGHVADIVGRIASVVLPALGKAFGVVGGIIGTVQKGFSALWEGARSIMQIFGSLAGAVGRAWRAILGAIRTAINAIIRGWNALKFTVPAVTVGPVTFGGFSIGTPNIPLMHKGGIVPGPKGADVPIMAQAGETVTPLKGGGRTVVIHFNGPVYGSDQYLDQLARDLARRLRATT